MLPDWRRQVLQLPSTGALTEQAVRAAYWKLIGARRAAGDDRLRAAKRQLLFELGQRLPPAKSRPSV